MKIKLYLLTAILFGVIGTVTAQEQNEQCMTDLQIFSGDAKAKNYDAAYEPWKRVYEACPKFHNAIYAYGPKILMHKIKKGENKEANVALLMKVYEDGMKFFPKKNKIGKINGDIAWFLYKDKSSTDEEIYSLLDEGFKQDRANFNSPRAIYLYFSKLVDLHKAGKKELQLVFDAYDDVTEKIEDVNKKLGATVTKLLPKEEAGTLTSKETKALKRARVNGGSYEKISGSIDTKLGALSDCKNLIPLYQKNFEEKKGDVKWVKRAVGRMFAKGCTDDPLFVTLVEAQNKLAPTADTFFYLGLLKLKKGDSKGAITDFNKSVELEEDRYKKAKISYKIATVQKKRGAKSSARNYANKALGFNPSMGKAHLLIAGLVASSANQCGSTTFEKKAIYWKAARIARKAGQVDPSIKGRANRAANSYAQRVPTNSEIFSSGMAGKTVTFSCWVGGSVKVPTL